MYIWSIDITQALIDCHVSLYQVYAVEYIHIDWLYELLCNNVQNRSNTILASASTPDLVLLDRFVQADAYKN